MKIVLVFPPFYHPSMYNLPPLGLINLASNLKNPGCQVVILDFVLAIRLKTLAMGQDIYDDCARMIIREDPDVVAFSVQCTTFPPVVHIAGKVRALKPDVKIVVGGHSVCFADESTLACFPCIDAVVRGEGESTFSELMAAYGKGEHGTDVAGVTFRHGRKVVRNKERELTANLDDLALPDYSLVPPLVEYRDACEISRSTAILEVGRGCPHRCIYCSQSNMWQRQTRTFSIERIVREMHWLHENYGAECFLLSYDQFTADRRFVEAFCQKVIAEDLHRLPWYCISRLDTVDAALLRLMREAGCESMCYGIDSGSKKTLAFIRKQIDEGILYQRVRETTDQGLVPTLSFVIGFPEEKREDVDATLELALKSGIQGNSNPLIQMPTVLPGTELFERYKDSLVRRVDTYFSLGIEFDDNRRMVADNHLIDSHSVLFSSFYNVPCRGISLEHLNLIAGYFPLIVNLYPKSFLLLSQALRKSVSELFLCFLLWVRNAERRSGDGLTPADCYRFFPLFLNTLLQRFELENWQHLREVVAYESLALEAGKFDKEQSPGNIDLNRLRNWRPLREKNILMAGFRYNIPAIVEDLKSGYFKETYSPNPTWLVFHHQENQLEVTEINDFGRDFLQLCDGSATVEEIAGNLYPRYGQDMASEVFSNICRQTIDGLRDMKFIASPIAH